MDWEIFTCMVQNSADFIDRSIITKIKISIISSSAYYGLMVGVVSPECKHKAMTFSSEELISSYFMNNHNKHVHVCMHVIE